MTLLLAAACAAALLLAVVCAFQTALAAGVRWGAAAYGGSAPGRLPHRLRACSAAAALFWAGSALVVLRRAGVPTWTPLPEFALPTATWAVAALLGVGIVLNSLSRSRIERTIWVPVTTGACAATSVVAILA